MKVKVVKAQRAQPPVDAYYVTESSMYWIADNITHTAVTEDGILLPVRSGKPQQLVTKNDVLIVSETGSMFSMRLSVFEEIYQVINEREDEI